MTYQVKFHWDRWEVVKEPDHRVMRQCKSVEEADQYAAKLSSYDELLAQLDDMLACLEGGGSQHPAGQGFFVTAGGC